MLISQDTLEAILQQSANTFHPVVPFHPAEDKLLRMDFTATNKNIKEEWLLNTETFCSYIDTLLQQKNCTYGIGGYNEYRTIYSRSDVFDAGSSSEEPRRLHLGIDIWGKAGTPVFAPLNGTIHSVAFNDRFGDYGATIITQHQLNGELFHILYGHLSLADLTNVTAGKHITAGEVIGHFGQPFENGSWPPHLHIQVIKDMQHNIGDYPGVCRYSEREVYLHNCPDPDFILRMMQYAQ
ncbi:peptidoglycan DD-metalloendopeptidase family protein [Ilyomonas limi]|nr:peptidoglycan DD-metalloendopeptidase family protein [Ilyomonas limi]